MVPKNINFGLTHISKKLGSTTEMYFFTYVVSHFYYFKMKQYFLSKELEEEIKPPAVNPTSQWSAENISRISIC